MFIWQFDQWILIKRWRSKQWGWISNNHSRILVKKLTDNQSIFDRFYDIDDWEIIWIPECANDGIRTAIEMLDKACFSVLFVDYSTFRMVPIRKIKLCRWNLDFELMQSIFLHNTSLRVTNCPLPHLPSQCWPLGQGVYRCSRPVMTGTWSTQGRRTDKFPSAPIHDSGSRWKQGKQD